MVDKRNPYAAPQADERPVQTFESELELENATLGTRFANFALDSIFRVLVTVVLVLVMRPLNLPELAPLFFMAVVLGYYLVFEAATGRTPAKYITGTRVVDMMGGKPSFLQILGRSAARFLPFEPFSFLGSSKRGWHDSLSRARVVRA